MHARTSPSSHVGLLYQCCVQNFHRIINYLGYLRRIELVNGLEHIGVITRLEAIKALQSLWFNIWVVPSRTAWLVWHYISNLFKVLLVRWD